MIDVKVLRLLKACVSAIFCFVATLHISTTLADAILLGDSQSEYALGKHLQILEDRGGDLTIDQVASTPYDNQFADSKSLVPNFGFSGSVFWIRFTLRNDTSSSAEWYLVQQFANTHYLDLYIPQAKDAGFVVEKSGNLRPPDTRSIKDRHIGFVLPLKSGEEKTYYLRMQSAAAMTVNLNIWKPEAFWLAASSDNMLFGVFYGILFIMLVYHAVLFLYLADKSIMWLAGFIASMLLLILFYNGHAQTFFADNIIAYSRFGVPLSLALSGITLLQFTQSFLPKPPKAAVINRIHNIMLRINLVWLVSVPFTPYKVQAIFFMPLILATLIYCVVRGLIALRSKETASKFYMMGWIALLISIPLTVFVRYDLVASNVVTENSYLVSTVWMILFMSIALAKRVHRIKLTADQSSKALHQSENQKQLILDAAKLGAWSWNIRDNSVVWSEETEAIFGFKPGEFDGRYETYRKRIANEDLARVESEIEKTISNQTPYYVEHRIVHTDGTLRWINAYGKLELDDNNKPLNLFGTVQDITEFKHTLEDLHDSEQNYRDLFDSAADGFVIRSLDGKAVDANPAVCAMYGYTRQEYLQLPLEKIVHPDAMSQYRRFKESLAQGKPVYTDDAKGIRKDGSTFYLQVRGNIIQYRGKPHIFFVLRDVTEQRRLQMAMKSIASGVTGITGEEFFQKLVLTLATIYDAKYAFIAIIDETRPNSIRTLAQCVDKQLTANVVYELVGTPCANVVGQYERYYEDNVADLFPQAKLLAQMSVQSYAGTPLIDIHGDALGIIVVMDDKPRPDISYLNEVMKIVAARAATEFERMKTEQLIMEQQDQLEIQVAERTAELKAVNRELESFSYSVSHDLRAPLRSIDGFSQILLEDYSKLLDTEGNQYLQRIRAGAQRMAKLIDDLLELSRVTRNDMVNQPVDLSQMVKDSIGKCKEHDQSREIDVSVAPDIKTFGDRDMLSIAIDNLVANSWKYTRKSSHPSIEFGATKRQDKVFYYIKDNGVGFDMKYADKLFHAFQRLHSADDFEGTGIGLATVARIIHRHGGDIWADAKPNDGATFYFDLHSHPGKTTSH